MKQYVAPIYRTQPRKKYSHVVCAREHYKSVKKRLIGVFPKRAIDLKNKSQHFNIIR